jgi:hypothetical protein
MDGVEQLSPAKWVRQELTSSGPHCGNGHRCITGASNENNGDLYAGAAQFRLKISPL